MILRFLLTLIVASMAMPSAAMAFSSAAMPAQAQAMPVDCHEMAHPAPDGDRTQPAGPSDTAHMGGGHCIGCIPPLGATSGPSRTPMARAIVKPTPTQPLVSTTPAPDTPPPKS